MEQDELSSIRASLEAERDRLQHQLEELGAPTESSVDFSVDEGFADYVGHDADPSGLAFFNSDVAAGLFNGELPEDFEFTVGSGTGLDLPNTGATDPNINSPRTQSWNLTFERQIGDVWQASASYLGNHTDRLWNQVKPLYTQLHCYARRGLNKIYGDSVVAKTGPADTDQHANNDSDVYSVQYTH